MKWDDLKSKIQYILLQKAKPYMLIIHLGGNSVVDTKQRTITRKIETDINYLYSLFDETIIVWSDILYRFEWQGIGGSEFKGMDSKRKYINRAGRKAVCKSSNGRIIIHDIGQTTRGFYSAWSLDVILLASLRG